MSKANAELNADFEGMLTGGHPNSLGRTEDVVALVLADRTRLEDLFSCYFSENEVVRLRVSSAMKRVTAAHPDWTMQFMDRLQSEVAAIDQASAQWTLASLFDLTSELLSPAQRKRAVEIMRHNLAYHPDWIVLNTTLAVLTDWAEDDARVQRWLRPHLERLSQDTRKSVAKRATKALVTLGPSASPPP